MIADISVYQGNIDWAQARKELELIILRSSIGTSTDTKYLSNAQNCDIPFGVYHYCKAGDAAGAEKEAEYFYKAATSNGLKPLFFVADIEYSTQTSSTTKTVCTAFANKLRTLGAKKIGLYIGQERHQYAGDAKNLYDFIWIPRYGKNTGSISGSTKPIYPCDLWQYTSTGRVAGISGNVDLNILNGSKSLSWFLGTETTTVVKEESKGAKMPISLFIEQAEAAVNRKDGYIFGASGQNPRAWAKTSSWFTQYSGSQKTQALYWREHAARVWDCQGLCEGLLGDYLGKAIDVRAVTNYTSWCDPKGAGSIPLSYRIPGTAVFWGTSPEKIHHIAYLYKPVVANKPEGDWYIIEARGVMYGVVITKLNERKPNYWGIMSKYFDYGTIEKTTDNSVTFYRALQKGCKGEDVRVLQNALINLGYNISADGDFGSATDAAVRSFQKANALAVDGIFGAKSVAKLNTLLNNSVATPVVVEPSTMVDISELGKRVLLKGRKGEDVKQLQNALIHLHYNLGKYGADGDFGAATDRAVRTFQIDNKLSVDGQFGKKSLAALKKLL